MRRVVVTGATGTIGTALCAALIDRGDQVTALSRDAEQARAVLGDQVQALGRGRSRRGATPARGPGQLRRGRSLRDVLSAN